MGAGDSRQRSDLLAGLPLISKAKRECPVGTPSFVLSGGLAAWGKGAPVRGPVRRAASHPPLRPAGRSPCPPCAAAVPPPARPACGSPGNVAAGRRLSAAQAKPAASRCAGPPSPAARPSPCGAASRALPPASPAPVAALVLRGGPAPTMWGLWGRPPLRPGRRRFGQPCQPGHACGAGRAARLCLRTRRPA